MTSWKEYDTIPRVLMTQERFSVWHRFSRPSPILLIVITTWVTGGVDDASWSIRQGWRGAGLNELVGGLPGAQ